MIALSDYGVPAVHHEHVVGDLVQMQCNSLPRVVLVAGRLPRIRYCTYCASTLKGPGVVPSPKEHDRYSLRC